MRSGRPGPMLLELPLDVAEEEIDDALLAYEPPRRHLSAADPADVERAVALLLDAERPGIYARAHSRARKREGEPPGCGAEPDLDLRSSTRK
ncbi:hypothetical protein ABZ642_14545 [Streptomyces sp. NPDC007157]|uniref:hypothetical protein n=1 Tax=Streptomyces sp. NPDC007157 TaxID=3154681 RepID=UPI0033D60A01